MSAPLIGRLLDLLPNDAWAESRRRCPHPRTDEPATRPVVLIHGTVGSRSNFTGVVAALREPTRPRRPILSISYGHHGTVPLHQSFTEVRAKLTGLIAATGPVDLVGHSQGGLLALAVSGTPELSGSIHQVIGLAGNFRGVLRPPSLPAWLPLPVPAWQDNFVGSRDLANLMDYAQRSTVPLTQILSTQDRIIPPHRARAFLTEDPASDVPAHRGPHQAITVEGIRHSRLPFSLEIGRLVAETLYEPPR